MLISVYSKIQEARLLTTDGEFEKALRILSGQPQYATVLLQSAECLAKLGRITHAIELAQLALLESPNSAAAELLLETLQSQHRAENSPKSSDSFRFGILFQDDTDPLRQGDDQPLQAVVHVTSNAMSMASVDKDIVLEPDDPEEQPGLVSETLARIMVKQGKYPEAKKVYIHLARENPEQYQYFRKIIAGLDEQIAKPKGSG